MIRHYDLLYRVLKRIIRDELQIDLDRELEREVEYMKLEEIFPENPKIGQYHVSSFHRQWIYTQDGWQLLMSNE